jgi:hypothetical protein
LVSAGPPKVGDQRGLSILPGVRTGFLLVQTMALNAGANSARARHGYGAAADCPRPSSAALEPPGAASNRVGGSTTSRRVSNARANGRIADGSFICQARTLLRALGGCRS